MNLNQIYAVIVNWNLKDDTVACIHSVVASGIPEANIILVDNGSHDESVFVLKQTFDAISLISNEQNLGFAAANNIGINVALKQSAEWVFLLNNDTIISPDFFSNIRKAHSRVGAKIYAPRINYFDEPNRTWYLGHIRIPGTLFSRAVPENADSHPSQTAVPIDFASGCGVLIHRNVIETVGAFNPAFFMYGEDAEFMWRISHAGFQIFAVPDALMWHKVSSSAGKNSPATRYWKIRNQIRFYRLHSHGAKRVVMFVLSTLRAAIIATRDVFLLRRKLLAPLARGWLDGWRNRDVYLLLYKYKSASERK